MNKSTILLMFIVLLIGCANPEVLYIERNHTVYINTTINQTHYINITNVMPCNITEPIINTTIYDRDYVLSLIRQLKKYEKQQDLYFNDSQCNDDLNRTEHELEIAENELCQWNSSWC